MLNETSVKNSRDSLKWKYQLKQITKTRGKNVPTDENCILRKMSLKLQLQNDLQQSLPEQAEVAELGADSMERAAQVKMQPV